MRYLIIAAIAWLVAQSLKHLAWLCGRNRRVFGGRPRSRLLLSGGMPSAHSATVSALAVAIGYFDGWQGAPFALAVVFAAVVIYDAVMVRFSSGQQGDMLNRLITAHYPDLQPIRIAHGHTPLEGAAGSIVGVVVAAVVIFATK